MQSHLEIQTADHEAATLSNPLVTDSKGNIELQDFHYGKYATLNTNILYNI